MEVVDAVVLKIVNDLDSESLARELAPAVREGLQGLALENILIELVRMLGEERHAKRILHSVLSISEQVLQSPAMQQVLLDNIKVLRKEYEGESAGRAFVLSALGLDDKEILAIFNEKAKQGIKDLLSEQTEGYARLKAGFEGMVLSFSNDASLRGVLGEWKERWLEQMDIEGLIASWIENALKGEAPFWLPNLNAFVEQRIDGLYTRRTGSTASTRCSRTSSRASSRNTTSSSRDSSASASTSSAMTHSSPSWRTRCRTTCR